MKMGQVVVHSALVVIQVLCVPPMVLLSVLLWWGAHDCPIQRLPPRSVRPVARRISAHTGGPGRPFASWVSVSQQTLEQSGMEAPNHSTRCALG